MSPRTHDYTDRVWGHNYEIMHILGRGQSLEVCGWGYGVATGDFLVMRNKTATTRYCVETIKYYSDPPDMWSATLRFAPRDQQVQAGSP